MSMQRCALYQPGAVALTERYPNLCVMLKPVLAATLVSHLEALIVDVPGIVQ